MRYRLIPVALASRRQFNPRKTSASQERPALPAGRWRYDKDKLIRLLMLVRILFFGILKYFAGQGGESLDLSDDATLGAVLTHSAACLLRPRAWASVIAICLQQS